MREAPRHERLQRLGKRCGIVAFGLIVAGITALWSIQILQQVWSRQTGPAAVGCRVMVRDLLTALQRARTAAAQESNGERAALTRFRQGLDPEWQGGVDPNPACKSDPRAAQVLSQLTALRYAEEHAVRYEAVTLAEQRRKMDAMAHELLGPDAAF